MNNEHKDNRFWFGFFIGGLIGAAIIVLLGTKEGKKIEEYLSRRPEARVFLLDERGVELTSEDLAVKLDKINEPIIFVIGGSLGLEPELLSCFEKLALSRLTFLHEMTKVVLLEQIYRSIAIIKGKNYHY